jgi:iron(III) transport system permease protein
LIDLERRSSRVLAPLLAGLYLLVVIGPLVALVVSLRGIPLVDWPGLLLPRGRRFLLWLRSVGLATGVSFGGMGLGLAIVLILRRRRGGPLADLRWVLLLLAPLPSTTHAFAWSWVTTLLNRALGQLGLRPLSLRGWLAAWWIEVLWLIPIAVTLAWIALESVDRRLIEAARLLQPDVRALERVVLPLAAPLLLAGCGLLFLLSLVDYTIPSLCQVNVSALDIFADFSVHNRPGRALLVSAPLLATTTAVVVTFQAPLRAVALNPNWHRAAPDVPYRWPAAVRVFGAVALGVILLAASIPVVSLVSQVDGIGELVLTLSEARREIAFSLVVAALAALLSLPIAYVAARGALSRGTISHGWWLAITVPMALPGPLVGIGLITLWNGPGWGSLGVYGSRWMPVLAALARYAPLGALVLTAALHRINPRHLEAAELLETSRLRTWFFVRLPLLAPGLLTSAGLVFCLTLSELSATLLVSPPGQSTLTIRIYNYLHYGASGTVAGLTLVLTTLVLVFGLIATVFLALWTRMTAAPAGARWRG